MTRCTTYNIDVEVNPFYEDSFSRPALDHYVFGYSIGIVNRADITVQLVSRHWDIIDALGGKREVEGLGVIGEQPVLAPGQWHQYSSGCNFRTPIGQMSGWFMFKRLDTEQEFKVMIPAFQLVANFKLN